MRFRATKNAERCGYPKRKPDKIFVSALACKVGREKQLFLSFYFSSVNEL
jgi:hypothetical protein